MRVGIVGAGSIAFGVACLLEQMGHQAMLWSPSGERTKELATGKALTASGAITGEFHPKVAAGAAELVDSVEVVVVALPGYGHKFAFDAIAPHVRADQTVIISSHASFGALYLSRELAAHDVTATIIAWGTTVVAGRQKGQAEVNVSTVRKKVDIATVPHARSTEGMALCEKLFDDRFVDRGSLMAIAVSNLNPQNHMGIVLCNLTRMERGETWSQGQNVTPKVGRLLEQLDEERLAIAAALGQDVRTIFQHFHLSFHVPLASISQMNQAMHEAGNGGQGPTTADSRYVLEDVPFGLVATAKLGRLVGKPAALHESGIQIFSALYGRDFVGENDLLAALDMDAMSLDDLRRLSRDGYGLPA
ncbi:MAG: NAD/NADP octopine/nopaline dehydrogenase [Mesorhizobium sp.]|uniref:NAD/NADP octopine/nopaline dehydrogenase family protein n=1 Tax=Mesorhizobium sp. TaxID=1871066 RepID=UPI0012023DFE|nr:NAD/NADP octopine/nopaline dehydrogenase family protein [Mesorhizobium sp.]TIQ23013.1 MAG: NAD/NADP octopine/nopaline dehydrogenase [Mesorhizobium sp.]